MDDARRENRRLWNEWSDAFQALWNADTAEGELPSVPCPFAADPPGGSQPDLLPTVEGVDFVESGGGGRASVGTAMEGADTVVGVDLARKSSSTPGSCGTCTASTRGSSRARQRPSRPPTTRSTSRPRVGLPDGRGPRDGLLEARRVLRADGLLVLDLPHPFYELFDPAERTLERSYHATARREIEIKGEYESRLVVFDRKVGDVHGALVDAGFDVRRILEPGSDDPDEYVDDPLDSTRPELMALVPRDLRFWATVG